MIFASSRSLMSDPIEEGLETERDARSSIEDDLLDDLKDDLEGDLISSRCCSGCLPFSDIFEDSIDSISILLIRSKLMRVSRTKCCCRAAGAGRMNEIESLVQRWS